MGELELGQGSVGRGEAELGDVGGTTGSIISGVAYMNPAPAKPNGAWWPPAITTLAPSSETGAASTPTAWMPPTIDLMPRSRQNDDRSARSFTISVAVRDPGDGENPGPAVDDAAVAIHRNAALGIGGGRARLDPGPAQTRC